LWVTMTAAMVESWSSGMTVIVAQVTRQCGVAGVFSFIHSK